MTYNNKITVSPDESLYSQELTAAGGYVFYASIGTTVAPVPGHVFTVGLGTMTVVPTVSTTTTAQLQVTGVQVELPDTQEAVSGFVSMAATSTMAATATSALGPATAALSGFASQTAAGTRAVSAGSTMNAVSLASLTIDNRQVFTGSVQMAATSTLSTIFRRASFGQIAVVGRAATNVVFAEDSSFVAMIGKSVISISPYGAIRVVQVMDETVPTVASERFDDVMFNWSVETSSRGKGRRNSLL